MVIADLCAKARASLRPAPVRVWALMAVVGTISALLAGTEPARAGDQVDLALVLAVDVSNSMDIDEQALQREGFVQAFRSPVVHAAIKNGALGRIAVIYMDWAGVANQRVVVPWTVIEGAESAVEFASRLDAASNRRAPRTSVSGAIDFSVGLLAESGLDAARRVIDVSGDGANNQGRPVTMARDEAVAKGITINGLPLMLKAPVSAWDIENLDLYYRDCVIGGQGAFMIPVRARSQFVEAVKSKIVREIAGRDEPDAAVVPAQAEPPINCLTAGRW